ncbi:type VII secretion protein EccB [Nocardiopsis xinjiangensis]|uniref:type VII secretion protein EccB n=1 Tax=Nocardiopsis xinjiangensis TaxID=124285 RepID=UPI000345C01C|nr:type VII secretion protein EccB [Nocardiopsis xinjiangensis]
MQTRRDQVQAHSFMVSRLSTAMSAADPDAAEAPLRRTRNGAFIGLVLGALLCVGFLVFGLLFPGGATHWRTEGTIVSVKGGGGQYVFSDGALWPVDNHASALLLADSSEPVDVSADSLEGTRVGSPVGIAGAPDALPSPEAEGALNWQVCAATVDAGRGEEPLTSLALLRSPEGSPVEDGDAVLVRGPDGGDHLVWDGRRLALDGEHGALESLGYGTAAPHPVSGAFLDSLPTGPALAPPDIEGRGEPAQEIDGARAGVGQVFLVPSAQDGTDQHYVLTRDGLAPVDTTRAHLLLGDPRTAEEAYGGEDVEPVRITVSELREHLVDEDPMADGLPATPPTLTDPQGAALCTVERGEEDPALVLAAPTDITGRAARPPAGSTAACTAPDMIDIPSGEGGLVRASPAGGSPLSGSYFLVTDTGAKYPVPDSEAADLLGYDPGKASTASTALLDMLPTGPGLSPDAAAEPVGATPEPGEPSCPQD